MTDLIYLFIFVVSYNPLERREACKGGKEASKKCGASQPSAKTSTAAAPKSQSSHNPRRNDLSSVNSANQSVKASKPPPSSVPAYDEQV